MLPRNVPRPIVTVKEILVQRIACKLDEHELWEFGVERLAREIVKLNSRFAVRWRKINKDVSA